MIEKYIAIAVLSDPELSQNVDDVATILSNLIARDGAELRDNWDDNDCYMPQFSVEWQRRIEDTLSI